MDIAGLVESRLTSMFKLPPDAVRPDVPLRALRVDSLALEELRLVLEDDLGFDLDNVNLTSRNTVGELQAAVCAKAAVAG
jgi:acyl carrier protein